MEWLLILLLLLGLITLIGHGFWVLLAWIFGGGRRRVGPRVPSSLPVDPFAELTITARQVQRLLADGAVSAQTCQEVLNAIELRIAARAASLIPPSLTPPRPVIAIPPATEATPVGAIDIDLAPRDVLRPTDGHGQTSLPMPPAAPEPVMLEPCRIVPPPLPARPAPAVRQPTPKPPRRSLSEVLASFMERKNIRWGELVGGLLIVGCSVALVLSFWAQISQRPVLKFSIFTAVTGALFGLGLYTEHRWKLPTTSRGVLLIATLLVPLNFLALAAFSPSAAAPGIVAVVGEAIALGLFAWLLYLAARVIAPQWPVLMTAGVLGLSIMSLAAHYAMPTDALAHERLVLALAAMPLLAYVALNGAMIARARRWIPITAEGANAVLLMLGVLTFAAVFPLALVVAQSGGPLEVMRRLAPLVTLAAAPSVAAGLLLWRRIEDAALVRLRAAGSGVAVMGTLVMAGAIGLAWPHPAGIVPVALIDGLIVAALAFAFRVPAGQVLAGACMLVAYAVGFQAVTGHIGWLATGDQLVAALLAPPAGTSLIGFVISSLAAAEFLRRRGRQPEARAYFGVAAGATAISLAIATAGGFGVSGDPHGLTWTFAAYAGLAILAAWRWRLPVAGWVAWALLLGAPAQWLASHGATASGWATGLLACATLATVATILAGRGPAEFRRLFAPPASAAMRLASLAIVPLLAWGGASAGQPQGPIALRAAWLALLWLAMALDEASPVWFAAGQLAATAAVALAVLARLATRPWFQQSHQPLLEPWTLQSVASAVALAGLIWSALRALLLRQIPAIAGPLPAPPSRWFSDWLASATRLAQRAWGIDRLASAACCLILLMLATAAVAPGITREFASSADTLTEWLPPHVNPQHAAGPGSWMLLAVLLAGAGGLLLERRPSYARLAAMIVAWAACPLTAARFDGSEASALGWACAAYLVLGALASALVARGDSNDLGTPKRASRDSARPLLLALGVAPVVIRSLIPACSALAGDPIAGPSAGSIFMRMGPGLSYGLPLIVVAGFLAVAAARRRASGYALAAVLAMNLAASVVFLVLNVAPGRPLDALHAVRLLYINAAMTAGGALLWMGALFIEPQRRREPPGRKCPRPLAWCVKASLATVSLLTVPAMLQLFLRPAWHGALVMEAGGVWGWTALLLSSAAAGRLAWTERGRIGIPTAGVLLTVLAAMAAFAAVGWEHGNWVAYHAWMVGQTATAGAVLLLGWWMHRSGARIPHPVPPQAQAPVDPAIPPTASGTTMPMPPKAVLDYQRRTTAGDGVQAVPAVVDVHGEDIRPATARCAGALGTFAAFLALRAMLGDPAAPWWSVAVVTCLGLLTTATAAWLAAPGYLYGAGLMFNLAATLWYAVEGRALAGGGSPVLGLLAVNAAALALPGLAWLVLDRQWFRRFRGAGVSGRTPFHRIALAGSTLLVVALAVIRLYGALTGDPDATSARLELAAVGSAALLAVVCLADPDSKHVPGALYLLGLAAIALGIQRLNVERRWMIWTGGLALAAYTLLTGAVWAMREPLGRVGLATGLPAGGFALGARPWITAGGLASAAVVVALALWSDFVFPEPLARSALAFAAIISAGALALLARGDPSPTLRRASIQIALLGAVALGWALIQPPAGGYPLQHAAAAAAIVGFTAMAALVLGRRIPRQSEGDWCAALRQLRPVLIIAALGAVAATLSLETAAQLDLGDRVPMHPPAIAAVLVTLLSGAAATVALALSARPDPLGLSDRGREGYVYAAEALLALAVVHLRLTVPHLFGGPLRHYWPVIVMLVAFAGVALGEALRRRGRLVLGRPLASTGVLLPVLPVVAFWFAASRVHYSALLALAGLLYGMVAVVRGSLRFGLAAALAGNAALWYLLHQQESLGLLVHPQLWVIPAALSVLAAGELNRARLSPEQLRGFRYASLAAVYVSSTADIFLAGVGHSPWLPMVLAGFSVAGVMAGLSLRIRPFLFLGTGFLTLAVVAMIWNAAVNLHWTWLWYVAGIVLGLMILTLFALFEKKREEMLAMVEGLRGWE